MHRVSRGALATGALAFALALAPQRARAADEPVIAPGNEAVGGRMLGGRAVGYWRSRDDGARRLLLAAVLAAAAARWLLAPLWIATVYIGYHLTQQAIDLRPIPHYGAGGPALYHALFALLPRSHRTLMGA